MKVTFFTSQEKFRKWLQKHHKKKTELLVGFYKVGSGKASMTWSQSVDQALCFGWIDSITKSLDKESYSIRFTPRKRTSIWSAVNINKVKELTRLGLMEPEGLKAFKLRTENRSRIYAHETEPAILTPDYKKQFKLNKVAWEFFNSQAPSYKKVIINWIMNAKLEKTRMSRLEKAIKESEKKKRIE